MRSLLFLLLGGLLVAQNTEGQETKTEPPKSLSLSKSSSWEFKEIPAFLGGALVGLMLHESGHYAMNRIIGTDPYIKRVDG